jgi:predicted ArsR family transcriptional regulator
MAEKEPYGPGLGETQRVLLETLKRRGPSTVAEVRAAVPLTPATLREHLVALAEQGLVRRHGTRRRGRGRPEVVWAIAPAAEALFPQREASVLRDLTEWLLAHRGERQLARFFADRVAVRRRAAKARVGALEGPARAAEVARLLSEEGYLAEALGHAGRPVLRIYHCPVKELVEATDLPCRAELGLVRELLGGRLVRIEHAAHRQGTCTYGTA